MKGDSNILTNLVGAWNILSDWIVWSPGDGFLVKLGEDPMIGSTNFYKLLEPLISCL